MFEKGKAYTRREISDALGGSVHDYLPETGGKIVCACLSQDFDFADPVILVGTGPGVQRQAELFCRQAGPVPLFFKQRANLWEYAGDFRCDRCSGEIEDILGYEEKTGRRGLTGIIFLKQER